jgi:ABC-2 type transport system permease protein
MMRNEFIGYKHLVKLVFRRDRVRIAFWLLGLVSISIVIALAYPQLFSSMEENIAMAETMKNPAMIAMVGPGYGFDNYTTGPMFSHSMLLFTALTAGIMNILLVTRHTRKDEEEGRIEMVRSLPVGRLASLRATLSVYFVVNIILAVFTAIGLAVLGIESMGVVGSLLYGAVLGITGFFFAALTALFAQILSSSRGVIGYSLGFLGLSYIIRAIGDISSEMLSLMSPLGLILRTEVYVNDYWWPIIVLFVISIMVSAFAFYLNYIRDLEAGFFKVRKGRTHASKLLQSPLGLAFRLQKGTIIAWFVTMFILGASYGSVFGDMDMFFESSEIIQ